jgi:hypothetical protein
MILMAGGLGVLSVFSGMLGLGVAFAPVPFLSLADVRLTDSADDRLQALDTGGRLEES